MLRSVQRPSRCWQPWFGDRASVPASHRACGPIRCPLRARDASRRIRELPSGSRPAGSSADDTARGHAILRYQVALKHLHILAVFQANEVVGLHRCAPASVRTKHSACASTARVGRPLASLDLEPDGSFALLGSNTQAIGDAIRAGLATNPGYAPARAIKYVITGGTASDIGGFLNLARLSRGSVEIYPEWRNPGNGLPRAYADDEIGQLGKWRGTRIHGR